MLQWSAATCFLQLCIPGLLACLRLQVQQGGLATCCQCVAVLWDMPVHMLWSAAVGTEQQPESPSAQLCSMHSTESPRDMHSSVTWAWVFSLLTWACTMRGRVYMEPNLFIVQ